MTTIKQALMAGAAYYGVSYPTGITVKLLVGRWFVYDHDWKIIDSFSDKNELDKAVNRAKIAASKELNK